MKVIEHGGLKNQVSFADRIPDMEIEVYDNCDCSEDSDGFAVQIEICSVISGVWI